MIGWGKRMDLLGRIQAAQKEAMKARDSARLSTVRMILAGVKDREIALRTTAQEMTEAEVLALRATASGKCGQRSRRFGITRRRRKLRSKR